MIGFLAIQGGATRAQPFTVLGEGTFNCGEYLQIIEGERKARPPMPESDAIYTRLYLVYVIWLDGFLSGYNAGDTASRHVAHSATRAAKMIWVENWCRANPLADFAGAAFALRDELKMRGE
jgi:hypothetical protein